MNHSLKWAQGQAAGLQCASKKVGRGILICRRFLHDSGNHDYRCDRNYPDKLLNINIKKE